jgi:NAD(P)-dependent dehydrogenase (short-subunit alcohol dehydrogenase family)
VNTFRRCHSTVRALRKSCAAISGLDKPYDVNVFGQVTVIQAFLPLLRRAAGRIITIGSIGDRLTLPYGAPLTSSKWALASITEALRLELLPWAIRVVLIEPASISTRRRR